MPRWSATLEDKCRDILDKRITNLHPVMYNLILSDVIASNIDNNKNTIELYVRTKIGATSAVSKKIETILGR